jgi:hypothetical protein
LVKLYKTFIENFSMLLVSGLRCLAYWRSGSEVGEARVEVTSVIWPEADPSSSWPDLFLPRFGLCPEGGAASMKEEEQQAGAAHGSLKTRRVSCIFCEEQNFMLEAKKLEL